MDSEKQNKAACNCKEANSYCDKAQYNEANHQEVQELQNHLKECPRCQEYTKKNIKLTSLCQKAQLEMLQEKERQELKRLLDEKKNL
jgi:hypothetical protein